MREAAEQAAVTRRGIDAETVVAAQRGDAAALEQVIRSLGHELLPLASALTGGSSDADVLVGETLTKVYERIGQLNEPRAILAWSRRVLVRTFLDERRWWRRRPSCRLEAAATIGSVDPDPAFIDVREAVRGLDRRDRVLLVLHYWQRLTLAECAAELGIPEGTAKSRLNRALKRLRARLGDT